MLTYILQDAKTGRQFEQVAERVRSTCIGCVFDDETEMCLSAGNACSDKDMIWTEILKVEKVDQGAK